MAAHISVRAPETGLFVKVPLELKIAIKRRVAEKNIRLRQFVVDVLAKELRVPATK